MPSPVAGRPALGRSVQIGKVPEPTKCIGLTRWNALGAALVITHQAAAGQGNQASPRLTPGGHVAALCCKPSGVAFVPIKRMKPLASMRHAVLCLVAATLASCGGSSG